jgi:hypothetical protein
MPFNTLSQVLLLTLVILQPKGIAPAGESGNEETGDIQHLHPFSPRMKTRGIGSIGESSSSYAADPMTIICFSGRATR